MAQSTAQAGLINDINSATGHAAGYADPGAGPQTGAVYPQATGTSAPAAVTQTTANPTSGGSTGSTTTGGSSQASWDSLAGQTADYINQLNDVYNSLYGGVDHAAEGQRHNIESGEDAQRSTLGTQLGQTIYGIAGNMLGSGIAGSSYEDTAENMARSLYGSSMDAISADQASKINQLASWALQQKSQDKAAQDVMNGQDWRSMYANNPYGLSSYMNSLASQLVTAKGQAGSYEDQPALQSSLDSFAPASNNGADQLKTMLSTLQQSSLPQTAKDQVASATISSKDLTPDQQNTWLNYYQNLGGSNNTPS